MKLLKAAVFFILAPTLTPALDPFSTSVFMGGAAIAWQLLSPHSWLKCSLLECCNMKDTLNLSALKMDLEKKVFGQHLAVQTVLNALSRNTYSEQPRKPLVMSFHGWTGTGKSLVSSIIAENLYRLNIRRRRFVHHFSTVLHFPHLSHVNLYKEQLQNWIRGNVSACPRSLFIFSEMDQMPHGLIDSIMPFLGYREETDGVYYGKAIFLFLNNAGGDKITKIALDYWRRLKRREDISVNKLQSVLSEEILRMRNSGFFQSQLIQKNLIDYFVPFLPLECKHVRECVREELRAQGHPEDEELVTKVASEMIDYPSEERLYSSKGCKTVASRVTLII
ncbi:torsin-1A [Phalacrocorax carbo]|uniref:torsin-1A n=1 Tax=Phalacrocorax carbo TaxID=9209 RepID=UPI0005150407|nr:PREDICTED: torsin-1A-like [Phalacrocorax carbo]